MSRLWCGLSKKENYILSPYFDLLSYWFHKPWKDVPAENRVGMMIKLADSEQGSVAADGTVTKSLTEVDKERLDEAKMKAKEIMEASGVTGPFVDGMIHGGHLGGTVPLTKTDVETMHPAGLPKNLWVADLSLMPRSQGLPTMLTAAALALKVTKKIVEEKTGNRKLDMCQRKKREYTKTELVFGNFAILVWILLGTAACWLIFSFGAIIFLAFAGFLVFYELGKKGCVSCFFCKTCTIGMGKLPELFFTKTYDRQPKHKQESTQTIPIRVPLAKCCSYSHSGCFSYSAFSHLQFFAASSFDRVLNIDRYTQKKSASQSLNPSIDLEL